MSIRNTKKRQLTLRMGYTEYRLVKGWARDRGVSAAVVVLELIEREAARIEAAAARDEKKAA